MSKAPVVDSSSALWNNSAISDDDKQPLSCSSAELQSTYSTVGSLWLSDERRWVNEVDMSLALTENHGLARDVALQMAKEWVPKLLRCIPWEAHSALYGGKTSPGRSASAAGTASVHAVPDHIDMSALHEEAKALIKTIPKDKTGNMSKRAVKALISASPEMCAKYGFKSDRHEHFSEWFNSVDTDHDGVVTTEELEGWLAHHAAHHSLAGHHSHMVEPAGAYWAEQEGGA